MPKKIITTKEQEQRLEQLYKDFIPMREIAKEFQCNERTIWRTVKLLGFTREKPKQENKKSAFKKLTLLEEQEIAEIGYNMTGQQLAEKYGVSLDQIKNVRKKYNLSWSKLHDYSQYTDYIIQQWEWRTAASLSQEIGCSKSYIEKIWQNAGLKNKGSNQYHADKHFLDNINSHEKAWFIGLIAADGCLYERNNLIQLILQKKDKETLEQVKNILKADNPIHENNNNNTCTLSICNRHLYAKLVEIGLTPKKTWTLDFNYLLKNVPEEFHCSLFRGYWDGDGTVSFNEKGASYSHVEIVAPWNTILIFQEYLNKKFGFSFGISQDTQHKYKDNFGSFHCNNTYEKYCLIQWLYSCVPAMQRKKENKEKLCALIESNKTNRSENKLAVSKWEELLEAWNGNQQPSPNALS